jgi:uncharacterized protein involved in exopolysaccharide biosynthesis
MDFSFYISRFMRRVHWFVLVLLACSALGVTVARLLPTVYLAEARLVVESEQIPDELAASTVRTEASEQLQIIQQRILTRDTLIEMANRLQIYAPASGEAAQLIAADDIVEDLRERIAIITTGGTQARGPVQATLVTVGFEAPTATMAAAVANEVVTLILREDVEMRTNVARQTLDFFEQEVARLEQELTQRGAAMLAFKEENQEALPDSLEFRRNQQAVEQERLLQITRAEAELRERRERLVQLHGATGRTDIDTAAQTPEQRDLQALQDELSRQLAVLSPQNPKIKLLEAQIASLEKIVAEQLVGSATDEEGRELSAYDIQLSDLDGQLLFMTEQKTRIAATMESLQASIEATPGNAIALETMERDYANVRAQYDLAVQNKGRAETGEIIEALSKGQRITVIEQAIAPREPASPPRLLIAIGGIAAGLGLGVGLVVLIEVLKAGIRRPADLTAGLGITPFATLPYLRTRWEIRRRRGLIGLAFALALIGIPAGLWAVHTYVTPLDLLIQNAMPRFSLLPGADPAAAVL